jgi:hypothetical protein
MIIKMVKIRGKYLISLGPAFSLTTFNITEYIISSADCQLFLGVVVPACPWRVGAFTRTQLKMKAVNTIAKRSHTEEVLNERIKYEKSFVLRLSRDSITWPRTAFHASVKSSTTIKYPLAIVVLTPAPS